MNGNETFFPSALLPYPLRQRIHQVTEATQAAHDLVAVSGLAIASLAVQYLVDMEREDGGTSSVALNTIILAESGDRKSTVASHFLRSVRAFEKEAASRSNQAQSDFVADLSVWDAKRKAILGEIRDCARVGEPTGGLERILRDLERQKPLPPIQAQMTYQDFTPTALLQGIATRWPSAAIMSDEASGLLRGRSFSNLALLNKLWDGEHEIRNRAGEYVPLRWPTRLTTLLMVQPGEFSRYMEKRGDSAHDIGSLARALICSPPSTQGRRFVNPQGTAPVEAKDFDDRVRELLELTFEKISTGKTERSVMRMSYAARQRWVFFFNSIEERIGPGRDLQPVRAFCSKIAENALRIAAVLQYFDNGALEISDAMMQAGVEIAGYFLNQHRRLFDVPVVRSDMSDANFLLGRLLQWHARSGVRGWAREHILRNLPHALRRDGRGRAALSALIAQGGLFVAPPAPPAPGGKALVWLNDQLATQNASLQFYNQSQGGVRYLGGGSV